MAVLLADNALEESEWVGRQTYRASWFESTSIEANAAKAVFSFEDEQSENWLSLAELEVEQEWEKRGGANYHCTVSPVGTTLIIRNSAVLGGSIRLASGIGISGALAIGAIPAAPSGFAVAVGPEVSGALTVGAVPAAPSGFAVAVGLEASGALTVGAVPVAPSGFAVAVGPEASSLFVGGYQLPSLHVSGYMSGLSLPWIQLPTYERFIERIDRVGYRTDPVLRGKGIPVWAIVAYVLDLDLSYEEVVSDWEGEVSMDEVEAAMEYYQAHPEEIEQKRRWASPR